MSTLVRTQNAMTAKDRICLALDMDTAAAFTLANRVQVGWVKVGMELYTEAGPELIRELKKLGFKIFLDLKYHDIPNTVKGAVTKAAALGVDLINVHAAGGPAMLKAAAEVPSRPSIIGVTLLTSLSAKELGEHMLVDPPVVEAYVTHMAIQCRDCGLDGVVASAEEAKPVRDVVGDDFLIVTPGIKPLWAAENADQKRITTPAQAIKNGADILVIGRAIYGANDPSIAVQKIADEISQQLNVKS